MPAAVQPARHSSRQNGLQTKFIGPQPGRKFLPWPPCGAAALVPADAGAVGFLLLCGKSGRSGGPAPAAVRQRDGGPNNSLRPCAGCFPYPRTAPKTAAALLHRGPDFQAKQTDVYKRQVLRSVHFKAIGSATCKFSSDPLTNDHEVYLMKSGKA